MGKALIHKKNFFCGFPHRLGIHTWHLMLDGAEIIFMATVSLTVSTTSRVGWWLIPSLGGIVNSSQAVGSLTTPPTTEATP